jgi:hypothetical protein
MLGLFHSESPLVLSSKAHDREAPQSPSVTRSTC